MLITSPSSTQPALLSTAAGANAPLLRLLLFFPFTAAKTKTKQTFIFENNINWISNNKKRHLDLMHCVVTNRPESLVIIISIISINKTRNEIWRPLTSSSALLPNRFSFCLTRDKPNVEKNIITNTQICWIEYAYHLISICREEVDVVAEWAKADPSLVRPTAAVHSCGQFRFYLEKYSKKEAKFTYLSSATVGWLNIND